MAFAKVTPCIICDKEFVARMAHQTCCSEECRFKSIVQSIKPDKHGCWIWPLSKNVRSGYGQFQSRTLGLSTAHRLSYTFLVGPIPEGQWVLHKCDVPACCNPKHLFLGTQTDNMADMKAKGRGSDPGPRLKKAWTTRRSVRSYQREIAKLKALLESMEWVQPMYNGSPSCPSCGNQQHVGHADGCYYKVDAGDIAKRLG